MTRPRFIRPGVAFYVTVRAVNRSFRFVPKPEIRKAIRYCLAVTLEKFRNRGDLVLHEFMFMSNHYHLLGTDIAGCIPKFIAELNSLIARELNAIRHISGANIEREPSIVEVLDAVRLVELSAYTLANPVAAFIVAKARHWPGVSSVRMRYGKPERVDKPKLGLWSGKQRHRKRNASQRSKRARYGERSKLPAFAELVIDRPAVFPEMSDDELRDHIQAQLRQRENTVAEEREERKIRILTHQKAEAMDYRFIPKSEEMFDRNPIVTTTNPFLRIAYLRLRMAFERAYAEAKKALKEGKADVTFPYGTWRMRVVWNFPCLAPS